jgi:hypothetical protein
VLSFLALPCLGLGWTGTRLPLLTYAKRLDTRVRDSSVAACGGALGRVRWADLIYSSSLCPQHPQRAPLVHSGGGVVVPAIGLSLPASLQLSSFPGAGFSDAPDAEIASASFLAPGLCSEPD